MFHALEMVLKEMKIKGFERIAGLDEITPEHPKRVTIKGNEIVLFRTGAEIFAVENSCPHQHYSVFHQSRLNDYAITCPMHGWSFDVRTGKNITGNGQLKVFEIRLEGNDVWMKSPKEHTSSHLSEV
jgi:nitrite reductase/ring-hydroxylating ferredoxin subunit